VCGARLFDNLYLFENKENTFEWCMDIHFWVFFISLRQTL